MSERIFGAVWLAFSVAMAWMAWQIQVPFAYEPVGPRALPLILALLMAVCALSCVLKPSAHAVVWPRGLIRQRMVVLVVTLFAYAFAFEPLGFPLATAGLGLVVGLLFGGRWQRCLAAGLGMGIGFYLLFDRLLDVPLPLGRLFHGFGG